MREVRGAELPEDPYGDMNRDIPISFERLGNEVEVRIEGEGVVAKTRIDVSDARLAIPRLIDELGEWGRFDAP